MAQERPELFADLLVIQDNILMAVRGEGLAAEEETAEGTGDPPASQKILYVLHPNCAVEEY